jgi:hypothetical protein
MKSISTASRLGLAVRPCCSHRDRRPGMMDRVPGMDLPESGAADRNRRYPGSFRREQAQLNPSAFRCSGQARGRPECSRSIAAVRPGG